MASLASLSQAEVTALPERDFLNLAETFLKAINYHPAATNTCTCKFKFIGENGTPVPVGWCVERKIFSEGWLGEVNCHGNKIPVEMQYIAACNCCGYYSCQRENIHPIEKKRILQQNAVIPLD
jgi:hypothetical protein